ncbi:GNAT family N-acetyltransferase [uncultured Tateyamaria sp.]|uniref:GNAT family N-acetyltransferase n=1 Tax=uncultured Tateyamaria sp. TaxID=455651 RepID=UPI00262E6440|nr:GNAT family N-acetyltransferase [uncultured Tateyamaria sp.]
MTVRTMTLDDLQVVLGWAADEGWNPGLDDAPAFHAADPAGFFLKEVDGVPAAAISVVNHDDDFAFLGLYLCKPEYRGQGHGMDVWRAGIAHAGQRSIGLDGVPDQQANYARSGFIHHGSTVRFEGHIEDSPDKRVRPATSSDVVTLIEYDRTTSGMARQAFLATWFQSTATRQTMVLVDGSDIKGFATFRKCRSGMKIGPFVADGETDALALLASSPFAGLRGPAFIDTQGHSTPLAALLKTRGFAPVFETARMFTGRTPNYRPSMYQAIATMELG